ncbi:MAG: Flp family type IVb pilin [Myxococcales bacterium]|nr:Flp family type IVb pilin [Myxococcales bacterium]
MRLIAALVADEEGATAIEYGLVASLIALAIVGAVLSIGNNLTPIFSSIATHV